MTDIDEDTMSVSDALLAAWMAGYHDRDAVIERLREANVRLQEALAADPMDQSAEIERLIQKNRGLQDAFDEANEETMRFGEENRKLRGLLREGITALDENGCIDDEALAACWPERVREALGGGDE